MRGLYPHYARSAQADGDEAPVRTDDGEPEAVRWEREEEDPDPIEKW